MLSGDGNENSQKHSVGLISKTPTLHVQHPFFVHFFAGVLHDHSVKFPSHTFYGGNVVCGPVHFFPLPLIFTLMATSITHFLTAAIKFPCYSSDEIGLLCFFYLPL